MSQEPQNEPLRLLRSPQGTGQSIKALFAPPERRLVKREVLEHVQHAQDALVQAQAEAAQIIEAAKVEAEQLRQRAHQAGLAQAQTEAMTLLGKARAEYDRLLQAQERDMLDLAFGIAQRIIHHSVSLDPQIISEVVAQTLEQVRHRRQILVLVSPKDLPILEAQRQQLQGLVEGAKLYFDEDPQISPGGCVIETESGRIDARLEVQLEAMKAALSA